MNNNLTPARGEGKEGAAAAAFIWIEDVRTRIAPASLGGKSYDEQLKAAQELAQRHGVQILLILTRIDDHSSAIAANVVTDLVNAMLRHHLRCLIIPSRDWISKDQETILWVDTVFKASNVTLITED